MYGFPPTSAHLSNLSLTSHETSNTTNNNNNNNNHHRDSSIDKDSSLGRYLIQVFCTEYAMVGRKEREREREREKNPIVYEI